MELNFFRKLREILYNYWLPNGDKNRIELRRSKIKHSAPLIRFKIIPLLYKIKCDYTSSPLIFSFLIFRFSPSKQIAKSVEAFFSYLGLLRDRKKWMRMNQGGKIYIRRRRGKKSFCVHAWHLILFIHECFIVWLCITDWENGTTTFVSNEY